MDPVVVGACTKSRSEIEVSVFQKQPPGRPAGPCQPALVLSLRLQPVARQLRQTRGTRRPWAAPAPSRFTAPGAWRRPPALPHRDRPVLLTSRSLKPSGVAACQERKLTEIGQLRQFVARGKLIEVVGLQEVRHARRQRSTGLPRMPMYAVTFAVKVLLCERPGRRMPSWGRTAGGRRCLGSSGPCRAGCCADSTSMAYRLFL